MVKIAQDSQERQARSGVVRKKNGKARGRMLRKISPVFIISPHLEKLWQRSDFGRNCRCTFAEMLGALEREGQLVVSVVEVEETGDATRR